MLQMNAPRNMWCIDPATVARADLQPAHAVSNQQRKIAVIGVRTRSHACAILSSRGIMKQSQRCHGAIETAVEKILRGAAGNTGIGARRARQLERLMSMNGSDTSVAGTLPETPLLTVQSERGEQVSIIHGSGRTIGRCMLSWPSCEKTNVISD